MTGAKPRKRDAPNLCIALKKFTKEKDFLREVNNLGRIRGVRSCKHITQSLATFQQAVDVDENIYYIMFPFAEGGDLDNFWESRNNQPRSSRLILWSLQQMLGLADALQGLHNEINQGSETNCRHGDLKPQNILHFLNHGEAIGILKIGDFGISSIHNTQTFARQDIPTDTRATTPSYEAPEASPTLQQERARSRKYDLWSLGCIYLEFVIWLVEDWKAIEEFKKSRATGLKGENLFYRMTNGVATVHPTVVAKILALKELLNCTPHTPLGKLLTLIETCLLVVDVADRIDSLELCSRLHKIVEVATTAHSGSA